MGEVVSINQSKREQEVDNILDAIFHYHDQDSRDGLFIAISEMFEDLLEAPFDVGEVMQDNTYFLTALNGFDDDTFQDINFVVMHSDDEGNYLTFEARAFPCREGAYTTHPVTQESLLGELREKLVVEENYPYYPLWWFLDQLTKEGFALNTRLTNPATKLETLRLVKGTTAVELQHMPVDRMA